MTWLTNPYSLILFVSALIALGVSIFTWQRRAAPGAVPLFLMLITTVIWAGANGFFLEVKTPLERLFWFDILILGSLWGTPAFLAFALQYTGRDEWLTRRNVLLICLVPAFTILLAWTNPWHKIFYAELNFTTPLPSGGWQLTPGTGYQIYLMYGYSVVLFSVAVIAQDFIRSSRLYRGQTGTILFGTLIPLVGNIVYNTILKGPEKGWIDPTPILFTVMGVIYAYGLFSFRLFDIVPVARHTVVENMPDGVLVLDTQNRIVDINPAGMRLLELTGPSPVGRLLNQLPVPWPNLAQLSQQQSRVKTEFTMGINPTHHFDLRIEPLYDRKKNTDGHLILFRDITEKKQAEQALQSANQQLQTQLAEIEQLQITLHEQAIRDALTGLFNRRYMDDVLKREGYRAERHQHPLSILMIEVDAFKNFNDTYGHEAGDLVLNKLGELIKATTRTDDIACRYGGDEFVLILPETPTEAAYLCAKRIGENMSNLQLVYQEQILHQVTLSIGIANFPHNTAKPNLVLNAADKAMYQAKLDGKNCIVIFSNEKPTG